MKPLHCVALIVRLQMAFDVIFNELEIHSLFSMY